MAEKFEHSALERDIEALSAELKERHGAIEVSKEQLKTIVREKMEAAPVPAPQTAKEHTGGGVLPAYLQDAPADLKLIVEKLLDLAWHKGISAAAKEARKQGALVLDAFHDALSDKMYAMLKERKK